MIGNGWQAHTYQVISYLKLGIDSRFVDIFNHFA